MQATQPTIHSQPFIPFVDLKKADHFPENQEIVTKDLVVCEPKGRLTLTVYPEKEQQEWPYWTTSSALEVMELRLKYPALNWRNTYFETYPPPHDKMPVEVPGHFYVFFPKEDYIQQRGPTIHGTLLQGIGRCEVTDISEEGVTCINNGQLTFFPANPSSLQLNKALIDTLSRYHNDELRHSFLEYHLINYFGDPRDFINYIRSVVASNTLFSTGANLPVRRHLLEWVKKQSEHFQEIDELDVNDHEVSGTIKLTWNGQNNALTDLFVQLMDMEVQGARGRVKLVPNNLKEIAQFLKQSFTCFENTKVTTIETTLKTERPKSSQRFTISRG